MMPDLDSAAGAIPPELMPYAVFVLVLAATSGLLWAVFYERLGRRTALRHRLELLGGGETKSAGAVGLTGEGRRKQSIEKALNELAHRERARQRAKLTIRMRLNQAGLGWTMPGFYARVAAAAVAGVLAVHLGLGLQLLFAAILGPVVGFLAVNFYVRTKRNQRMRSFIAEFPNALDIVTRGVKTGLPLSDTFKAIAKEGQEPVKGEFGRIVDDVALGLPLSQALTRFTHRVPIMEANFFAVVIAIQSQLGGNLSEALGNLSRVLRERKMMKEKIRAFSSEATSSGAIIASMPVAVGGILSLTSPDYIGLLFSEFVGNVVLAGCAVWMLTGVIVMRNMIRFDF